MKIDLTQSATFKLGFKRPRAVAAFSGRLQRSRSGWLLLSVPNAIIRGAFFALDVPGAELPYHSDGTLNAHISVMRPDELVQIGGLSKITEVGKRFNYQLGELKEVEPIGWKEMERVWFLQVDSPDLENLRKSYGLSPLPTKDGRTLKFHITVAVRRRRVLQNSKVRKVV